MNLLLIWLLFGVAHAQDARPEAELVEREWRQTHVNFSLLEYYLEKVYPCTDNATYFLSCLEMINGLGEALEPRLILVPQGHRRDYPEFELTPLGILGKFEMMRVVQPNPPGVRSPVTERALKSFRRRDFNEAAEQMFANDKQVPFKRLAQALFDRLPRDRIEQKVIVNTINRMIHVVDAHGGLSLRAEEVRQIGDPTSHLVGLGAELGRVPEGALIKTIFKDGAAEASGLNVGEVITHVDDIPLGGHSVERISRQFRAADQPVHRVRVLGRTEELTVRAKSFNVPAVRSRVDSSFGAKIAILRLSTFQGSSLSDDLARAITDLPADTQGLILNLRGNLGGLAVQAVEIAGEFLGRHVPVFVQQRFALGRQVPTRELFRTTRDQITSLPLVILVDHSSASAAELLAGAIQDHQRGFLVGTRTFGKGTIQDVRPFQVDERSASPDVRRVALHEELNEHRTFARFYQPGGHSNQFVGLTPDFEIYPHPVPTEADLLMTTEADVPSALPPQGAPWTQPRPDVIEHLRRDCLSGGRAQAWVAAQPYPEMADYQMAVAEELLTCLTDSKSAPSAP